MRTKLFGSLTGLVLAVANLAYCSAIAETNEPEWRYATSLIGMPQMPVGFQHFPYVNPDAPKAGTLRLSASGTFDSLNIVLSKGVVPDGLVSIYDTLTTPSKNEISTEYGLIADALKYPKDYSWVIYRLRPEAHWHDGKQITTEDVAWSFDKWRELNPFYRNYYMHVTNYEILSPTEIRFNFKKVGNREAPQIIGQLIILPKHWWTGKDRDGNLRDIAKGTLEAPLSSGPYTISNIDPGRSIAYQRVQDYWGEDLNVNIGTNNFDKVTFDYYRDDTVELEAFKADRFDWRDETIAKNWSTAYDIPAVNRGDIIKEEFPQRYRGIGLTMGFVVNVRRDIFKDRRVRKALNYAFNFEEFNRTLFYDLYVRINSNFFGTVLAASGLPEGRELEILKSLKAQVPDEVFTEPYENPVSRNAKQERSNLRKALNLLKEAGYAQKQGKLVSRKTGKPLTIEYLINSGGYERVALRYKNSLKKIGIDLQLRVVDSAQYVNRLRNRDFDLIYTSWIQTLSPGNEQRGFWGSEAADNVASRNFIGIKDPVVDELIDTIVVANDRKELIFATRALDRYLSWQQYVIPGWTSGVRFSARWDRFSHAKQLPEFEIGFPNVWWWDEAKAQKIR